MTVQEVIDLAKTSELKSLAIGNDENVVLGYLNMGVLELYKRFPLKVEEHIIELQEGVSIYEMPQDFMWIIAAYGEVDEDDEINVVNILPVNKEDDPLSINTIGWNKVQVPLSVTGAYISIIYSASPYWYKVTDLEENLDLPPQMLDALLDYIAYKGHASIDSGVNTEDSVFYQKFEAACNKVLTAGMFNMDDMNMDSRIKDKGFV